MLAFIAFIAVQLLSDKSIDSLKASEMEMLNSHKLSKRIATIEFSISAYENKITSFVLTGNKNFLLGNEENLREVTISLQYVHDLSVSSEQNKYIVQLDSLVQAEINFCQQALIAYDNENREDAVALINTANGKLLIDNINNTCYQVQQLEENNLAQIIHNNNSFSRKVVYMDYAASAFAIAVILFSMIILFRDINKRIKVEKQLRLAQHKAEQLAIIKEQFMANMSHEIRTPMNAILGFANILRKSAIDDKQANHVKAIQTSGENLLTIINDILDFSKIEAGMVNIEKIPFSPAALLHSVNVMFLPKANDKHIQLNFSASGNLPETLIGDPTRLTQILVNLISNSLKFTSEGNITVKAELLKQENEIANIQFLVKDTGIGIPTQKLDEIFERFTQANADTNRKYGGSGLGLSIVKKLLELQNGSINVESAVGVGSSFSFVIPYRKTSIHVAQPPLVSPQVQPKLKTKINILVAEDNTLNQQLAHSLLTDWGFDFDIVENGKLAVVKLKKITYDLILMDIQMPEMNGYDAAQFIRQNLHLTIPIIAMTAHVLPGEKDKCISYGMTDYISKPIRENELYNLIAKYINGNSAKVKPENANHDSKINNSAITNLSYLKELSNGKPGFVNQMIELFLSEVPEEIQRLESAIHKQDFKTIHTLSHKIKSTISFAGLDDKINSELNQMEELAFISSNLPQIEILFSKIKKICLKAVDELCSLHSKHD